MRVSHEATCQALYIQGRGALRRELAACLRTGRVLRVPRARARQRSDGMVTPEVMISARPAQAGDRAVPGHWEGDLIIGLNKSAIGTLVKRTTRFTMLLHLPRMDGYGAQPRVKNGPPLAGHGAEAVRDAIAATIITLPAQLRRTLTWDRGKGMAQHAQLRISTPASRSTSPTRTALAARHQRKHQWPAAPVLPQRHRPQPPQPRRPGRRRRHTQRPPPQNPSAGRPQPRPSTNSYTPASKAMLRRPLELKLAARVAAARRSSRRGAALPEWRSGRHGRQQSIGPGSSPKAASSAGMATRDKPSGTARRAHRGRGLCAGAAAARRRWPP